MSASSATAISNNASVPGGSTTQSGPPYLCPTCQTSYSRLEYLRRHERRHADIRPFVCECGKGFSRSDVLSRHKRQCAVILNGGSAGDVSVASSNGGGSKGNGGNKKASNGRASRKNSNTTASARTNGGGRKSTASAPQGDRSDSLHDTPDDDDDDSPPMHHQFNRQHQPHPHQIHQHSSFAPPVTAHGHAAPGMNVTPVGNSFPFPPQPGVQIGTSAPPPLLPPAPYATDASTMMSGVPVSVGNNQSFPGMIPPHLSSFTNLVNSQHHYPSSPESNGTISQHSSPRFSARDMARHGSNGSRFSLRKGGSFDHIGPRAGGGMTGTTPNQYAPEFWDALDPAARHNATDYVSAGASSNQANLSLTDGGSGIPLSISGGLNGVTTPRGEPQRFAVSTGPLSPFSSIALSSAMSPYLSAFSNARDTPFVASPSRGIIPGTPGASLNVFDWTMRPPSKPASSSMSKRDSISQQGTSGIAVERNTSSQGGGGGRGSSPSQSAAGTGTTTGVNEAKRKHEEEEGSRKSPKLDHSRDEEEEPLLDEDQRSAAELLDSLRNAGSRSSQATGSDGGNVSIKSVSSDIQPPTSGSDISNVSTAVVTTNVPASVGFSEPVSSAIASTSQPASSDVKIEPTSAPLPSDAPGAEEDQSSSKVKSEPFFEQRNVTAGPEAFLLRLQGGAQEEQAGTGGPAASALNLFGQNALDAGGMSLAQLAEAMGGLPSSTKNMTAASISQSSWEALINGSGWPSSTTPTSAPIPKAITSNQGSDNISTTSLPISTPTFMQALNEGGSMSWLLSPGVQQLINTFAPQPGDGGSYFAGENISAVHEIASKPFNSEQIKEGSDKNESEPVEIYTSLQVSALALEKALADVKNPFYIPPALFRSCYSIPHWQLPPITRLSVIALHAQQNLLKHIPIIHEPTFRLDTTPGCLAFAMCMLGCHEHGRMWWAGVEAVPRKSNEKALSSKKRDDTSNIHSRQALESLFHDMSAPRFDEEDGEILVREIVMSEKADMLLRSFSSRAKSDRDKISVLQSLLLFQSTRFISSDQQIRSMAALVHPSLVTMARKAGLFVEGSAHSERSADYTAGEVMESILYDSCDLCFSFSYLPAFLPGVSDDEKVWRMWTEMAGRRRAVFAMLIMDTIACLDAGVPNQIQVQEIDHFPLPTPDTIWRAVDVKTWRQALERYRGPTMKQALKELLDIHYQTTISRPSIRGRHGPFARLAVIVTLLRGIVHFLDGQDKGVESLSPLSPYMVNEGKTMNMSDPGANVLKHALIRWRKAWDADDLCMAASGPEGRIKAKKLEESDTSISSATGNHHLFASHTASGATSLMEDALPFYWLSRILLENAGGQSETNREDDPDFEKMKIVRSILTIANMDNDQVKGSGVQKKLPDLPNFRNLLKKAKMFVDNGEKKEKGLD